MNTNQQYPPVAAVQQAPTTMQTAQFPQGVQAPHQVEKYKKAVRGLAIAEVVLGCLCVLGGIILVSVGYVGSYGTFTTGEGMWCGIWIIVAGAIGIPSGGKNANRCLVTCHMAFSIVGALFSCTLFGISVTFSFFRYSGFGSTVLILIDLASFASMIILIISASFCCYLIPGCCQGYIPSQTQVIYVATNNQQPIMMQQPGMPAQGYVIQGYQPAPQMQFQAPPMMVQQPVATGSYQPPVTPVNQNISTPQTKEQEASQVGQPTGSFPPSYSRI